MSLWSALHAAAGGFLACRPGRADDGGRGESTRLRALLSMPQAAHERVTPARPAPRSSAVRIAQQAGPLGCYRAAQV